MHNISVACVPATNSRIAIMADRLLFTTLTDADANSSNILSEKHGDQAARVRLMKGLWGGYLQRSVDVINSVHDAVELRVTSNRTALQSAISELAAIDEQENLRCRTARESAEQEGGDERDRASLEEQIRLVSAHYRVAARVREIEAAIEHDQRQLVRIAAVQQQHACLQRDESTTLIFNALDDQTASSPDNFTENAHMERRRQIVLNHTGLFKKGDAAKLCGKRVVLAQAYDRNRDAHASVLINAAHVSDNFVEFSEKRVGSLLPDLDYAEASDVRVGLYHVVRMAMGVLKRGDLVNVSSTDGRTIEGAAIVHVDHSQPCPAFVIRKSGEDGSEYFGIHCRSELRGRVAPLSAHAAEALLESPPLLSSREKSILANPAIAHAGELVPILFKMPLQQASLDE